MLKNRYYSFTIGDDQFFIRVKKDFYTEGISINDNRILQGYFDFYNYICLNILDNNDLDAKIDNHKGIKGFLKKGLSFVWLDEEFIEYQPSDKIPACIKEIEEDETINKIDFLIRTNIRKLSQNNKQIYDFFNNQRMRHYNEIKEEATAQIHLLNGGVYIPIDDPELNFTREDLEEIKKYLETLNQSKKLIKGRDEKGKKVRKKRK